MDASDLKYCMGDHRVSCYYCWNEVKDVLSPMRDCVVCKKSSSRRRMVDNEEIVDYSDRFYFVNLVQKLWPLFFDVIKTYNKDWVVLRKKMWPRAGMRWTRKWIWLNSILKNPAYLISKLWWYVPWELIHDSVATYYDWDNMKSPIIDKKKKMRVSVWSKKIYMKWKEARVLISLLYMYSSEVLKLFMVSPFSLNDSDSDTYREAVNLWIDSDIAEYVANAVVYELEKIEKVLEIARERYPHVAEDMWVRKHKHIISRSPSLLT